MNTPCISKPEKLDSVTMPGLETRLWSNSNHVVETITKTWFVSFSHWANNVLDYNAGVYVMHSVIYELLLRDCNFLGNSTCNGF